MGWKDSGLPHGPFLPLPPLPHVPFYALSVATIGRGRAVRLLSEAAGSPGMAAVLQRTLQIAGLGALGRRPVSCAWRACDGA